MDERDGRSCGAVVKDAPWLLAPNESLEVGKSLRLGPAEARHVAGSLRRRSGDEVMLADGAGTVATAVIQILGKGRVDAEVLAVRSHAAPEGSGITLALAVIDRQAMDWAVQKAVEVGVRRLVPVISERTQIGIRDHSKRVDHLRRIAMQALKQCRRPWAMAVEDAVPLQTLVERESDSGGVVVADRNGSTAEDLPGRAGRVLVVGPEGGFTAAERELFEQLGWAKLRLGEHVLRAETAAIVGSAMLVARLEGR
jgi:16S rRNA (uracil1498-N3)-methyltransferase